MSPEVYGIPYYYGDVNYDLLQPNKAEVKRYTQVLQDLNLKQLMVDVTRPESGSLIDHAVVRSSDDTTAVRVVPCSWTDHDLVIADASVRRERRRPPEITVRATRSLVPDALCLDLLQSDWTAVDPASK